MFLTPDELADLTGYKHREKQKAALRSMGIKFETRPDGRPRVLRCVLERRHGLTPIRKPREPDFSALDKTG